MARWIRLGEHRVALDQIEHYYPAGEEAEPGFKTEIEMVSGTSFYVMMTPEELDKILADADG